MKVGMIGLGRMGEGMSRRLIAQDTKYMGIVTMLKMKNNMKRVISVDIPLL